MKLLFQIYVLLLASVVLAPAADVTIPFRPENPPGMEPLANRESPAYMAARQFLRGVNLGDYLEAGSWAIQIDAREFRQMKAEGFDHVRVPTGWHRYCGEGPDFKLQPQIFARVDFAVSNALANDLAVIINLHHFNAFDADPAAATPQLIAMWRQIAEYYKDAPANVAFELNNEPHDKATTAVVNEVYPLLIAEIRKSNPRRTLFAEPGNWGNIAELKNLVLPPDDNLIVSVHCYDPFLFTHQGTSWAGPDVKVTGFKYPGPPETPLVIGSEINVAPWVHEYAKAYNTTPAERNPVSALAFRDKLRYAKNWSDHYGRPVHLGEFGCYFRVDPDSRVRFYQDFRRAAEALGLGWAMWDWSSNFRYWERSKNEPVPGMREAMFGK